VFGQLGGDRVSIVERRSCVDLTTTIVCRLRNNDRVSILWRRLCVDREAVFDSQVFDLDLKNLHRGGECRERAQSQRRIEFFNSMPQVQLTMWLTDMHKNRNISIGSVGRCCTRKKNPFGQSTDISSNSCIIARLTGRSTAYLEWLTAQSTDSPVRAVLDPIWSWF